jgi:sugar phosphate isomerase/epimerase
MRESIAHPARMCSVTLPGLCSVTLRACSWQEVLQLAVAASLEAVEWGADVHVLPGDLETAGAVARRCADEGVRCPSYGSYLWAGAADGRGIGAAAAVLDTAAALGASTIRMWCRAGLEPADATPEQRHAVARDIAQVADDARARGLSVALEHHPGTLTLDAESTRQLLEEVARTNVHTYWQPRPDAPADVALAELVSLVDDLAHLHVFTWGPGGERFPLADGAALWEPALAATTASSARWPEERVAYLEFVADDDPERLAEDAATLRRWLGGAPAG